MTLHWVVLRQKISSLLCNSLRKSQLQHRWVARSCRTDVEAPAITDSTGLISTKRLQTAGASSSRALRAALQRGAGSSGQGQEPGHWQGYAGQWPAGK